MAQKKHIVRCPICNEEIKDIEGKSLKEVRKMHPHFPFCSQRCQFIDLNAWLESDYKIEAFELDDEDEV